MRTGALSSRTLVPVVTVVAALAVSLGVGAISGGTREVIVSIAAVVLIGTLVQGEIAAERAIMAAAKGNRVAEVRAVLRLAVALGGVSALALAVMVLGVPTGTVALEFGTAVFLTVCAGVLNLICAQIAVRYAATVERHLP